MKRYDSYKLSHINFLDQIPSHWKEIRMRFLGYLYGGLTGKSADDFNQVGNIGNKAFIPFTNIANNSKIDLSKLQEVVITDGEKQNKAQKGDLFFLMSSENYEDVGKSAVLCDDVEDVYLNSFCKGFRVVTENINSEFLNYQLSSSELRHNLLTEANGFTRINLKIDKVNDLTVAIPPEYEQTAIVSFLDRKTAEIDQQIANKKRLIELYEEEKTAIINQAVTKGIDPNVKMKDSEIEWLGEIPKHWKIKRLKFIASVQTGRTPKIQNSEIDFFENGDINWFTPSDFVDNGELKKSNRKANSFAVENNEIEVFDDFSIFLVSIGATLGKVGYCKSKASANQQINIITFQESNYEPMYGYYYLLSNKEMIKVEADYTTLPILNQTKTKNLWVLCPSLKDQKSIIIHIETKCKAINSKIERTKTLIDLLTEYRTTLISEVATGRIKVTE